jgi:hypothetical protein
VRMRRAFQEDIIVLGESQDQGINKSLFRRTQNCF